MEFGHVCGTFISERLLKDPGKNYQNHKYNLRLAGKRARKQASIIKHAIQRGISRALQKSKAEIENNIAYNWSQTSGYKWATCKIPPPGLEPGSLG